MGAEGKERRGGVRGEWGGGQIGRGVVCGGGVRGAEEGGVIRVAKGRIRRIEGG